MKTAKQQAIEPTEIYITYDSSDGEVFCAFTDKERCETEANESGCSMKAINLYTNQ